MMSRSTPSTACTCAIVRCTMPDVTGNHFFTPRRERSGCSGVHSGLAFLRAGDSSSIFQLGAGLRDPASGHLRLAHPRERWRVLAAAVDLECTARMERASARQVDEVRRYALDGTQRLALVGVEPRDRLQERPGVGMLRMREYVRGRARLDDPARVHDDHALTHAGD